MIEFLCDSCGRAKDPSEIWILGMAAEALGVTAARREVSIISIWDRERAIHPFAVHFCSEECKDNYIRRLFAKEEMLEPVTTTEIITTKVRNQPARVVKRTRTRKTRKRVA